MDGVQRETKPVHPMTDPFSEIRLKLCVSASLQIPAYFQEEAFWEWKKNNYENHGLR